MHLGSRLRAVALAFVIPFAIVACGGGGGGTTSVLPSSTYTAQARRPGRTAGLLRLGSCQQPVRLQLLSRNDLAGDHHALVVPVEFRPHQRSSTGPGHRDSGDRQRRHQGHRRHPYGYDRQLEVRSQVVRRLAADLRRRDLHLERNLRPGGRIPEHRRLRPRRFDRQGK